MNIRLTQIDGKLPNLALMKLARHHRDCGDDLHFTKHVERDMLEPDYDRVYGSAIFSFSADRVAKFRNAFPDAILGGTHDLTDNRTVEQLLGIEDNELYDYSIYPRFDGSIGFSQRGCRLKCGFCVVPKKEGKPRSVNTIASIWRGEPWPKHIHLLDNDFFGQPRDRLCPRTPFCPRTRSAAQKVGALVGVISFPSGVRSSERTAWINRPELALALRRSSP